MRVAIVYDWANQIGGAERIVGILHEIWPKASLYTSAVNFKGAPWADKFPKIETTFLQKVPGFLKNYRLLAPLIPFAFEQFNFDGFDVVISVTSGPAKAIITKPKTCHICYCLTPPRYFWEKRFLKQKWLFPLLSPLRGQDYLISKRPDFFAAISKTVAERIKNFYQRESQVIYPGILENKIDRFGRGSQACKYFLIVSRLVYYKRVDIAVAAFNKLRWKLKIVGSGPEEHRLRVIAGNSIEFLGNVSDERLWQLYRNTQALVCPQEEDFGLTALEAQSMGIPVITFKRGGITETVIEGETGEFFEEQSVCSLIKALKKVREDKYSPISFRQNISRFRKEDFLVEFKQRVEEIWQDHQKKYCTS